MKFPPCSTCVHLVKLMSHPRNVKYKGEISLHTGLYGCTVFTAMSQNEDRVIVFEDNEGSCEMHQEKDTNISQD